MSRQTAEDGAFGYIVMAAIAIAVFLQFIAPGAGKENEPAQKPVMAASQPPYYLVTYTYRRLPPECRAPASSPSAACEAIRNAPPRVTAGWHASEAAIIELAATEGPVSGRNVNPARASE